MDTNRSPGQQVHDALLYAAEKKNDALQADKIAKRVFSEVFLRHSGSIEERKHIAGMNEAYLKHDDTALLAESAHNLAKAEADGLECRFKEWQANNANRRAEMGLL